MEIDWRMLEPVPGIVIHAGWLGIGILWAHGEFKSMH